jgi:hypothetical protein
VVNGEIYNHKELRADLEAKGYKGVCKPFFNSFDLCILLAALVTPSVFDLILALGRQVDDRQRLRGDAAPLQVLRAQLFEHAQR